MHADSSATLAGVRNQRIGSSYLQGILADGTARYLPRNAVNRLLHNGGSPFRILHGYGTVPFGFHYLIHPAYTYEGPGGGAFAEEQRTTAPVGLGPVPRPRTSSQHTPVATAPTPIPQSASASNASSRDVAGLEPSQSTVVSAAVHATLLDQAPAQPTTAKAIVADPPSAAAPSLPAQQHSSCLAELSRSANAPPLPTQQRSSFLAELSRKLEAHNFSAAATATQRAAPPSQPTSLPAAPPPVTLLAPAATRSTSMHRAVEIHRDTTPVHHLSVPEPMQPIAPSRPSPATESTLTIAAPRLPEVRPAAHQLRIPDLAAGTAERTTSAVLPTPFAAITARAAPQPISSSAPRQPAQIRREALKSGHRAPPTPSGSTPHRRQPAPRERRVRIHPVVPARRQSLAFLERSQLAVAGLRLYK